MRLAMRRNEDIPRCEVAHILAGLPTPQRGAYNGVMFLLLHGADEFSAREELAALRASPDFGLSQDVFDGAQGDLTAIRQACETLPFLSERRLVVVEGLPKRRHGAKDEGERGGSDEAEAPPATKEPKGKRSKAAGPDPKAFAQGLADLAAGLPETTM